MLFKTLTPCALLIIGSVTLSGCSDKEEEITKSEIPFGVTNAVEKQFPGFTIEEAERKGDDDDIRYEIEGRTAEGKEYELKIDADGTILKIELED